MTGYAVSFGLLFVFGLLTRSATIRFLLAHGRCAPNYLGRSIPEGTGLLVWLMHAFWFTCAEAANRFGTDFGFPVFGSETDRNVRMAAVTVVFVVGWLDDSLGDRSVKGMREHWRKWLEEGTVTTGLVKAAGVGAAALWIALAQGENLWETAVGWLVVTLSANALNLLDVRPGRAWKSFGLGAAFLLLFCPVEAACEPLLPALAAGLLLFAGDLRGKHMLGDSGANLLGFALGSAMTAAAPVWAQAAALVPLAALHRIAETGSITAWIERHKWIRWLDQAGRA